MTPSTAILPETQGLLELIPESCWAVRNEFTNPEAEGHTLLLCLVDRLATKDVTLEDLRLSQGLLTEQEAFIGKLRAISAYAIVIQARGGIYSLDEQVDDFLLFSNASGVRDYQGMTRFRRASLQTILWTIQAEGLLKESGTLTSDFSLPIDILVALGDEVARWHSHLAVMPGERETPVSEASLRDLIESSLVVCYCQILDKLHEVNMAWALDSIRRDLGLPSVRKL